MEQSIKLTINEALRLSGLQDSLMYEQCTDGRYNHDKVVAINSELGLMEQTLGIDCTLKTQRIANTINHNFDYIMDLRKSGHEEVYIPYDMDIDYMIDLRRRLEKLKKVVA